MDIAQVVKRSGLPASTLRYYEEKGLIASLGEPGERRRFAPQVLDQLALIALGQSAGFSLDDIASMFGPGGQPDIDRQMLTAKADELDATIKRLRAMSRGLRHAAACPAPSHGQCPVFQGLLSGAVAQNKGLKRTPPQRADGRPREAASQREHLREMLAQGDPSNGAGTQ